MRDALETLGRSYVPLDSKRDAVHIAVAPVKPVEDMAPGTRVVFVADGDTVNVRAAGEAPAVGIIDPFLSGNAHKGWKCWMLLMPRSTTGLRHEYDHPAFSKPDAEASEEWLRSGCKRYRMDYDELIDGAVNKTGGCFGDDDGPEWASTYEFWQHIQNVTGKPISEKHRSEWYFRCAC